MPPHSNSGDIVSNSTLKQLSYYDVLGVSPQSSQADIRNAYRRKSKQYHPDTTLFDEREASQRFQALNQAYETLRFPEKRQQYDALLAGKQASPPIRSSPPPPSAPIRSSATLDPEDRALSAGEIFALFILGVTFLFCLLVALLLGISRGEMVIQSMPKDSSVLHQLEAVRPKSRNSNQQIDRETQPSPSGKVEPLLLQKGPSVSPKIKHSKE